MDPHKVRTGKTVHIDPATFLVTAKCPPPSSLRTLVTFTPKGGFHVWLRTKEPTPKSVVIVGVTEVIPFEMDLVRGEGQQVVVPPFMLQDVGNYWFMDDSKIRREGELGIGVI